MDPDETHMQASQGPQRDNDMRRRRPYVARPRRVHYVEPSETTAAAPRHARYSSLDKQRLRIQQFQRRWQSIEKDLPPQITRRHSKSQALDDGTRS